MSIKIAILDDHQIVIDGLRLLLKDQANLEVVAEFTHGEKLLNEISSLPIDLLITDIMMPGMDGFEVAKQARALLPNLFIIALSMNGEGPLADKMIHEAGVNGYLLKTADKHELLQAINSVTSGETYFSKEIVEELKHYAVLKKQNEEIHLTAREIEIIQCIANDLSNKQIADQLFISERTVETHRKNIFRKVDIHSVVGLIDFAKKRKII